MSKKALQQLTFLILFSFLLFFPFRSFSQDSEPDNQICAVYLTAIGCPACAEIEKLILSDLTQRFPGLVVIEYELYQAGPANQKTAQKYFESFTGPPGVPSLVLDKNIYIGPTRIKAAAKDIEAKFYQNCPLPGQKSIPLNRLKPSELSGMPRIWTKNRVFILESNSSDALFARTRDTCVAKLIQTKDIYSVLKNIDFEEVEPKAVNTSRGNLEFENAVMIGNWRMQWNKARQPNKLPAPNDSDTLAINWFTLILAFSLGIFLTFLTLKRKQVNSFLKTRKKRFFIVFAAMTTLILFFFLSLSIDQSLLQDLGRHLSLPLFTFAIALVDGFNPCNIFVLTVLLTLLVSTAASRKRFYLVGFIFVLVVFLFYLLFMAAWLNVFKYIGFTRPLRLIIATIAIGAGLINCKEFFFFKKGPSLMIAEKHKKTLYAKMRNLTQVIEKGPLPLLIASSVTLAVFSSLVEIPCTAGFPILYTSVLSSQVAAGSYNYIFYLIFYNLVYVFPLLAIIAILGFTFRAKKISQKQIQVIKLIGGIIMIALGIVLLANPQLIGVNI